jgi:hypothetical protein
MAVQKRRNSTIAQAIKNLAAALMTFILFGWLYTTIYIQDHAISCPQSMA